MPQLDVSFMMLDEMLSDCFSVQRRVDLLVNGRTTPTIEKVFEGQRGIITQQDPAEIMRTPDAQMNPKLIFVASSFAFRGVAECEGTNYQPDIIVWSGAEYLVKQVMPYSRYGAGIHECIAESMQAVNKPQ